MSVKAEKSGRDWKDFFDNDLTREWSFGIILNPADQKAAGQKKNKKEFFWRPWHEEKESYNSQLRQLERACSLKIDQRTDKREYLVVEDNQEKLRLF